MHFVMWDIVHHCPPAADAIANVVSELKSWN